MFEYLTSHWGQLIDVLWGVENVIALIAGLTGAKWLVSTGHVLGDWLSKFQKPPAGTATV